MAKHWNWTKNEQQQKKTLCLRVVLEFTHPENDILSGQNFSTNLNRDGFCRQQQKRRGIGKIYIYMLLYYEPENMSPTLKLMMMGIWEKIDSFDEYEIRKL